MFRRVFLVIGTMHAEYVLGGNPGDRPAGNIPIETYVIRMSVSRQEFNWRLTSRQRFV